MHHGWTNDPNGPFELNGVHHLFYQSRGSATVFNGGDTFWGHVAGNLSHWHCLPAAIAPGVDYDGTPTPYDAKGIFTGSVTVVDGVPVATYPGEPGDKWCDASPANLSDPLLRLWKKSKLNPLGDDNTLQTSGGPIGCTAAWKEASGNWTTTIQSSRLEPGAGLKTAFFTSHDFIHWSWVGDLDCPVCDKLTTPCCDFYPLNCTDSDCTDPGAPGAKWAFGVNSMHQAGLGAGGVIQGTFDRQTLKFTPDRADWAAEVLAGNTAVARRYAYDYGGGLFAKTYADSTGRRIAFRWITGGGGPASNGTWFGMQTVPNLITQAAADDATAGLVGYPVPELAALRASPPLASLRAQSPGAAGGLLVSGVTSRHYDAVVTFRGLASLPAADRAALSLTVDVFAPLSSSPGRWNRATSLTWAAAPAAPAAPNVTYGNNTDIQSRDVGGVTLPEGTTDEQGVAACTEHCAQLAGCAAWVFVSARCPPPCGSGHPRCALKGHDFCPPTPHTGTITGAMPGQGPASAGCKRPVPPGPRPPAPPAPPGWIGGQVNGGPLALRDTQDTLEVRVLVDGSVVETFWDMGRARQTQRILPPAAAAQNLGLRLAASSPHVTADVDVYAMNSAWLAPVE